MLAISIGSIVRSNVHPASKSVLPACSCPAAKPSGAALPTTYGALPPTAAHLTAAAAPPASALSGADPPCAHKRQPSSFLSPHATSSSFALHRLAAKRQPRMCEASAYKGPFPRCTHLQPGPSQAFKPGNTEAGLSQRCLEHPGRPPTCSSQPGDAAHLHCHPVALAGGQAGGQLVCGLGSAPRRPHHHGRLAAGTAKSREQYGHEGGWHEHGTQKV